MTHNAMKKKYLSLLLTASMLSATLIGCGDTTETNTEATKAPTETPAADTTGTPENGSATDVTPGTSEPTPEVTAEPTPEPTAEPTPEPIPELTNEDRIAAYSQFLYNELPAFIYGKSEYLNSGDSATFEQINAAYSAGYENDYLPSMVDKINYSYIDCGNDGTNELLVYVSFLEPEMSSMMNLEQYYIFDYNTENGIRFLASDYSYYRTYTTVNSCGVITGTGSGGSNSLYSDISYVDANGDLQFYYSIDSTYSLAEPLIPLYQIPDEILVADYPLLEEYDDNGYSIDAYCFRHYVDGENYADYYRDLSFVFCDASGRSASLATYYTDFYDKMGIKYYNDAQIRKMIKEKADSIGLTDEILAAPDPEWTNFYTRPTEIGSVEQQIQLLADNSSMWYIKPTNDNVDIYYFVADLDRNDHLELVRYEKDKTTLYCKNRFYEVNTNYDGVYEMYYELTDKWYEGEDAGYFPDFSEANGQMYCFSSAAFGSALEDYAGPTYLFTLPCVKQYDSSTVTYKVELSVNNQGRVGVWEIADAHYDSETGYTYYTGPSGYDCEKEEYDNMEFLYFSEDTGWTCDQVYFSPTSYITPEDCFYTLWYSYSGFYHIPYEPAQG